MKIQKVEVTVETAFEYHLTLSEREFRLLFTQYGSTENASAVAKGFTPTEIMDLYYTMKNQL